MSWPDQFWLKVNLVKLFEFQALSWSNESTWWPHRSPSSASALSPSPMWAHPPEMWTWLCHTSISSEILKAKLVHIIQPGCLLQCQDFSPARPPPPPPRPTSSPPHTHQTNYLEIIFAMQITMQYIYPPCKTCEGFDGCGETKWGQFSLCAAGSKAGHGHI